MASEQQGKLSEGRAAVLACVVAGALVAACGAPLPTEIGDAVDVQARGVREDAPADRTPNSYDGYLAKWFVSDAPPLVFVDDVRVGRYEDLPESVRLWSESGLRADGLIARVEVIDGPGSRELYGEEGANGAIRIFTKDRPADEEIVEAVAEIPAESDRANPRGGEFSGMAGSHPFPLPFPLLIVDGVRVTLHGNAYDEVGNRTPWPDATPMPEDLKDIDRLEVFKGVAAVALYGKEAVGGVILISLKK